MNENIDLTKILDECLGGIDMLTEKDYCDHDTCIALKELGYPIDWFEDETYHENSNNILLYEAQKWLREEKNIYIEVYACARGYIYELCKAYRPDSFSGGTIIYTPDDFDNPKLNDAGEYDDFETCLLEGIKDAIKILKKDKTILG